MVYQRSSFVYESLSISVRRIAVVHRKRPGDATGRRTRGKCRFQGEIAKFAVRQSDCWRTAMSRKKMTAVLP